MTKVVSVSETLVLKSPSPKFKTSLSAANELAIKATSKIPTNFIVFLLYQTFSIQWLSTTDCGRDALLNFSLKT